MKILLFERDGSFLIQLHQTGKERFTVRYGEELWKGDYEYASRKLGEALMHDLACGGRLDTKPIVTATDLANRLADLVENAHGKDADLNFVLGKRHLMVETVNWNEMGDAVEVKLSRMD